MYRKEVETMSWKKVMSEANVKVSDVADFVGISYFVMGQMLDNEVEMPVAIKNAVKFFLVKNYTKRIEKI